MGFAEFVTADESPDVGQRKKLQHPKSESYDIVITMADDADLKSKVSVTERT
jgi:hypothetical protein